jgi:TRAP-type C4-dicarboxylate transport system permease small subunit
VDEPRFRSARRRRTVPSAAPSRKAGVLFDASFGLSRALAQFAKLCLGLIVILIVIDVTIRNLGGRPPLWTVPVTEYLMLYITALGVPYLVRVKGHVLITIIIDRLAPARRRRLERAIYLVSAACFLFLGLVALVMTVDAAVTGDFQARAFKVPTWIAYLPIPIGFVLSALEFGRYLIVADSLFDRRAADADSL